MNPRVQAVQPHADYTLTLTFTNGENRVFDVKPYLQYGIFKELQDKELFYTVKPYLGSIQWKHKQDFCPDTLYMESFPVASSSNVKEPEHKTVISE